MPEYEYRAMTSKGQIVKNRVEDVSKNVLIKKLKGNDLLPISVIQVGYKSSKRKKVNKRNIIDIEDIMKQANSANILQGRTSVKPSVKERVNLALSLDEKITTRDIMIFTQNFFLLKKANFNNIHALSTIIGSTENLSFRGVLEDILAGVEAGEYMYTTMEYYSDVFPYLYINMIRVGELSGNLTRSLEQAIKYLESSSTTRRTLKGIIIPNALMLVALIGILIVGVMYVIPMIQEAYAQSGTTATLPDITIWFMDFCQNLGKIWYIPVVLICAIIGMVIAYVNTPKGKYNYHYFKYKMPIFGKLIFSMDFARLMRAILLNLQNGMRIADALEVSKSLVKNYVMLSIIETSINNLLTGASWIEPFENSGLCSSMQTEMLKIGMQTDLSEMMEKLVEYMEIDIDNLMQKVMKVLPQLVYSIVGVFIIFLVLVILVPCLELYMGGWLLEAYLPEL